MEIRRTDLSQREVVSLLELHHGEMEQSSPPGTSYALDLSGLQADGVEVFAAWEFGQLQSIGAIKHHSSFAEIKSMRTHPDALRTGAGRAMLTHLVGRARDLGFGEVKLETGNGPVFEAANSLYQSFGFTRCSPFADYIPSEFNTFYSLEV